MNEVYKRKRCRTGSTLSECIPKIFGRFLDYCRELAFDEEPAYRYWQEQFSAASPTVLDVSRPLYDVEDTSEVLVRDRVLEWDTVELDDDHDGTLVSPPEPKGYRIIAKNHFLEVATSLDED